MRLPKALSALAHRNFRLYFAGQGVSVLGTWVQQVALSWLVYRLTGSAELLGLTAFLAMAPQLVVGPASGALFDRFDRRTALMIVQGVLAAQALVLAVLTATGLITPALIVAMALGLGILNGLDTPLRQSIIGRLVDDRGAIRNALALNAMLFNLGRFIGPPLAGLLLSVTSEALCFGLNALSFLALVAALLAMRVAPAPPPKAQGYREAFREGLDYALGDRPARTLLALVAILNVTASSYIVLMPIFAREVFGGDARMLGWLIGAAGCGAIAATVFLAVFSAATRALLTAMAGGILAAAAALVVFSQTAWVPLGLAMMAVVGFGISITNVGTNAILQSLAPDDMRGRVASFFTACRFGLDAIGGLLAGVVAGVLGAPETMLAEGVVLLVAALWFQGALRRLHGSVDAVPGQAAKM